MAESEATVEVDVLIVGAGFAGMYALHQARQRGWRALVIEAGEGVGGTWYWNRYPGARCDVESIDYSYGFSDELQQEWSWTERYATQPEILSYARHVAERFDLERDIRFSERVLSAHRDSSTNSWTLITDGGNQVRAEHVVLATGPLSSIKKPDFAGIDDFEGEWYHTARWPDGGVDLTGKRVGVVGTGSTGVQLIPLAAEQADQLVVFQRTANFVVPARNRMLTDDEVQAVKATYPDRRVQGRATGSGVPSTHVPTPGAAVPESERAHAFAQGWAIGGAPPLLRSFSDVVVDEEVNESLAAFVRERISDAVDDASVASLLTPTDHPIGAKRLCVGTNYYETYNRPNVKLVDVRADPIERVTAKGMLVGAFEHELDVIVFATGFDAVTGAAASIDIRSDGGPSLAEEWAAGPRSYLGLGVSDYPNLFLVNGPGSPAVLGNVMAFLEYHVEWITECIDYARTNGVVMDPDRAVEQQWMEHVDEISKATLYPRANSWFLGANVPGKKRQFLPYAGGFDNYQKSADAVAQNDYAGFAASSASRATTTIEIRGSRRDDLQPRG